MKILENNFIPPEKYSALLKIKNGNSDGKTALAQSKIDFFAARVAVSGDIIHTARIIMYINKSITDINVLRS